ncbi:hypothetical protein SAMN05216490_0639 [Mucilaginibacter mallensis]|uniref:ATPase AAA-type core domain-containing protein n=2 Tax=Mucilaginibacter mallensis TaxID=652787 RepID=A0A1H1PX60_MUCMA|nr:hypothetical protein SAMN05216490_0639 [Mucilaginibacter mallensis]
MINFVLVKKEIMLLSFATTNFRSVRDRVELSMLKTGLKGLPSNYFKGNNKNLLLRSAVIYGPNASGKSGFLRAIKALEYLVKKSTSFGPDESIAPFEPHRLEKSCSGMPVTFEISFIAQKLRYEYIVAIKSKTIELEELYYYPTNTKTLLYSRVAGREIKFGDYYKGAKKTVEKMLLPNQLFLSKAAENNVDALLDVYRFFTQGLTVYPMMEDYHENNMARLYAKRLAEDKESKFSKRFNALICALDTGICAVAAEEVDWNDFKFPGNLPDDLKKQVQEDYKYDIKTQHPVFDGGKAAGFASFDVSEESAGTKSLFVIGGIILDALDNGRVLVVDEFEKNLHPSITQFLIQLFHNPVVNPNNAQLVFATHDITQLSNDHFRRDQVWFTEKNEYGSTSLYRCSDIQGIRLGTPLDKWYASGRFGATPIINDVDFLIEMQGNGEIEG